MIYGPIFKVLVKRHFYRVHNFTILNTSDLLAVQCFCGTFDLLTHLNEHQNTRNALLGIPTLKPTHPQVTSERFSLQTEQQYHGDLVSAHCSICPPTRLNGHFRWHLSLKRPETTPVMIQHSGLAHLSLHSRQCPLK